MAKKRRRSARVETSRSADANLIGTVQATKELGISPATLRRWVSEGRVEAVKVGKQWRFRREDLRRFLARTAHPESAIPVGSGTDTAAFERQLDNLLAHAGIAGETIGADIERETRTMGPEHDLTMARLLIKCLVYSVACGASDLHFEPFEKGARMRQRLDGLLAEVAEVPRELYPAMMTELKRFCKLNVAERFRPQDGRFIADLAGHSVDVRLNIVTAQHGDVAALRILDRGVAFLMLERQGIEPPELEYWRRALHAPSGLLMLNGPAGCGKTTTAYASLTELTNPGTKIMTAEDPVEYMLPGVSQVQMRSDMGLDFRAATAAMLRQAVNVMYIGEIRTPEVAALLCQAAASGHLVMSSMHASDALVGVQRFLDIGVDPHTLASALLVSAAQRLVRLICPDCRVEYRPSAREVELLNLPPEMRDGPFFHGKGCPRCRNLGYRGRAAVFQVLPVDAGVRSAIHKGEVGERLMQAARSAGLRTMREIALDKVRRGDTTIEEVVRQVLGTQPAL